MGTTSSNTVGVDVPEGVEGGTTLARFVYLRFRRGSEAGVAAFFAGVGTGSGEYALRLAADSRRSRAGSTRLCGVSSAITELGDRRCERDSTSILLEVSGQKVGQTEQTTTRSILHQQTTNLLSNLSLV